jgi:hypothetical protein
LSGRYGLGMHVEVRDDLARAHAAAWAELASPGPVWTGQQRVDVAATVVTYLADPAPSPPWVGPSILGLVPAGSAAPPVAHDIVARIARHAGTLTESWYGEAVDAVGELAYIELVALTATVAAVWSFRRAVGLPAQELPVALPGPPTGLVAESIEPAHLNWVPVAGPADQTASVVQAFTALPSEHRRTWMLADAQYIPDREMIDPNWTRGTLTRPQIELVAMRVAQRRDCFF